MTPAASPYIRHPIGLARLLAEDGGVTDAKTRLDAVLHDTIEDTATTHYELHAQFGKNVADVVTEVTNDTSLPKPRRAFDTAHALRP